MRATGRPALGHALAAMLATAGAGRLTLGGGDEAVLIGVQPREGGRGPGLRLGDHDGTAVSHPPGARGAAVRTAMTGPGAALGAGLGPVFAAGLELGLADDAVIVGVEPAETGVGAAGPTGLGGGPPLVRADGAVAVGVGGGETLDARVDELGTAETLIAIGVGANSPGLRMVPGLLGDGDAAGGEGQGGQSARHKGLSHFDVSMAARRRRPSLSGE